MTSCYFLFCFDILHVLALEAHRYMPNQQRLDEGCDFSLGRTNQKTFSFAIITADEHHLNFGNISFLCCTHLMWCVGLRGLHPREKELKEMNFELCNKLSPGYQSSTLVALVSYDPTLYLLLQRPQDLSCSLTKAVSTIPLCKIKMTAMAPLLSHECLCDPFGVTNYHLLSFLCCVHLSQYSFSILIFTPVW